MPILINRNRTIHALFDVSLIGKAIDGALEVIGGVALFFVDPDQINQIIRILTQQELREDPRDVIAGLLLRSVQHLSADTKVFAALFLLWHGAVKVGLVIALRRRQQWAYPAAIAAFGIFLIYQVYRYSHTRSVWLLALSFLDLCVIIVTWLEYKRLRSLHDFRDAASGT